LRNTLYCYHSVKSSWAILLTWYVYFLFCFYTYVCTLKLIWKKCWQQVICLVLAENQSGLSRLRWLAISNMHKYISRRHEWMNFPPLLVSLLTSILEAVIWQSEYVELSELAFSLLCQPVVTECLGFFIMYCLNMSAACKLNCRRTG
jgi:hypothetical protein